MAQNKWLPLTDYSSKYKVSISTLRRRIKADQVEYTCQDGRYLINDKPLDQQNKDDLTRKASAPPQNVEAPRTKVVPKESLAVPTKDEESAPPMIATVNQLLNEIKKAYSLILQEKEEQIIQLREELVDLKTLVRVLESENDRLKTNHQEAAPIDSWLDSMGSLEDLNTP